MRVGDVLDGRYELEEKLGQGGFGVVWRARDTRMRRPVAVKVIGHHGGDHAKAALRFVREACAAGNLSHPHIVTVHDLGQSETAGEEVTFLVMELLTGRTLTEVLRAGVPEPALSLRWARQICGALAAAHDAGMVHRDIKPDNVMITDAGHLKVLDFGIAQLDTGVGGLTTTGTIVGSPAYMAPERWTGGRVDGRADLYALGCVLVELLTGARPFGGDSTPVLLYQHLNEPPPALDPARLGLPPQVAGLIAELLAKDPQERPADARTVERRLAELAEWRGEAAAPEPTAVDPSRPAPTHSPVTAPPMPVTPPPPVPAHPPVAPRVPSASQVLSPLTTPPVVAVAPSEDAVRAGLRERRSAAYRAATAGESAILLQAVAQDCVAALGATDRDTLCTWRDFAWYLSRAGDLDGAIRLLSTLVDDMRPALGPADPDTLGARYHLVWCVGESGSDVTAIRLLNELLPDLHAAWGPQDGRVLKARHDLAVHQANRGDLQGAVMRLHALLPDLARAFGEHHPSTVQAWQDLAGYQQRLAQAGRKGGTHRSRAPRISRMELLVLVRRLRVWDFATDQEAGACVEALERGLGVKGAADVVFDAPDHVSDEDLVEEIFGP
ncbi:serine/threonine-protein kinase [Kitasatospora cathayae]|uniref:non-specific serine/threonine protein kinase n=1 Tax=Kitasatospora cathayae TaxID=3004092 RepID=A0ABY7Q2W1_9ACTN|nr:serine/threonine-protein kinase [Kitasatospora sp. HUAS 3-15]WBP87002.1 serine/threonine-protein kinase [Kitasatospora sp. HUAS 3-15]